MLAEILRYGALLFYWNDGFIWKGLPRVESYLCVEGMSYLLPHQLPEFLLTTHSPTVLLSPVLGICYSLHTPPPPPHPKK